jgi:hypothetical protein
VLFAGLQQKPIILKPLLMRLLALLAGMVIVFTALLLVMAWCGVFKQFWFWTVEYARAYISQVPLSKAKYYFWPNVTDIFIEASLLWSFAGIGIILSIITRPAKFALKGYMLLLSLFSILSICPGFYFRQHYFVLLLPCVAILCGVMVYVSARWLRKRLSALFSYGIPVLLIMGGIAHTVAYQYNYLFTMSPEEVCRSMYSDNPFTEALEVADYIKGHTEPDEKIAIFGSEPQIFFYSQRRAASGYIYMYPLMERHEFALQMQKDFIRETEAESPEYCILVHMPFSWCQRHDSKNLLIHWMYSYLEINYDLVGTVEIFNDHSVYHWDDHLVWPVSADFSIEVYKKKTAEG